MRNLLVILIVLGFVFSANAQRQLYKVWPNTDTLTDAGSVTLTTGLIYQLGTVYFHTETDTLSGTEAGDIFYEWSIDGTNWHPIASDTLVVGGNTDASHTIDNFSGRYARIRVTGDSGSTQSALVGKGGISFKRNY